MANLVSINYIDRGYHLIDRRRRLQIIHELCSCGFTVDTFELLNTGRMLICRDLQNGFKLMQIQRIHCIEISIFS